VTTITDNFDRANAATIGTSAEGWSWQTLTGTMGIASNAVDSQGGATGRARANSDLATSDHYAQFDVTVTLTGNSIGPCVRFDSAANSCYQLLVNPDATNYRFFKCVAGVETQVGSTVVEALPGLPFTLRFEITGNTLTGFAGGVSKITTTDATFGSGPVRTGCRMSASTTPRLDNFSAGDLTAGGVALFRYSLLNGLGSGGPLFNNPLG
jgi:hypothetical protein